MPVTGVKQPTGRISYGGGGTDDVRFIVWRFAFEGLPTSPEIEDEQIIQMCIEAEGDALPNPDELDDNWPDANLPLRNVDVRRYPGTRGEARITISWGTNIYTSGPAPAAASESSSSGTSVMSIPVIVQKDLAVVEELAEGDSPSGSEPRNRIDFARFERPVSRRTIRRLLPSAFNINDVDAHLFANQGKLYNDGILVSEYVRPFSASQSYVYVTFENRGGAPRFDPDHFMDGSLEVDPLPINGEYKTPDENSTKTEVIQPSEQYEAGANIPWLQ